MEHPKMLNLLNEAGDSKFGMLSVINQMQITVQETISYIALRC